MVLQRPDPLVARMRSGDLDAFEEFFTTYERPVYTTALAITRDPFLAEEILQDCFVKAYRNRHRLRTDRSPLPWLHRVTTNLCYSRIARRRATALGRSTSAFGRATGGSGSGSGSGGATGFFFALAGFAVVGAGAAGCAGVP